TLHGAALALLAYASLGAPAESVTVLTARVERLVTGGFRPDRQAAARSAFEGPAAVLAFPITGATPLHRSGEPGGYLLDMQRAMALRAELAAAAGDQRTARWWAQRVTTLWRDADVPLQPLVRRMRLLAGAT